jgi:hypothetical protein
MRPHGGPGSSAVAPEERDHHPRLTVSGDSFSDTVSPYGVMTRLGI